MTKSAKHKSTNIKTASLTEELKELKIISNGNYMQFMHACAEVRKQKAINAELLAALDYIFSPPKPLLTRLGIEKARAAIAKAKGE